ncbi:MAG: PQQ-binding-like beta-propeller repeat protein [Planctomycetaceae bacterium]|nr:PQQ-binding-like beta-propeller repeat protein [Planctomycetaceae bacterium]
MNSPKLVAADRWLVSISAFGCLCACGVWSLAAESLGGELGGGVPPVRSLVVTGTNDPAKLWKAAREGDLAEVQTQLEAGVDVNAATPYGATALSFACDRGHLPIVVKLLEAGANPNVTDTFYGATPLTWAHSNEHFEVVSALLAAGADGADQMLLQAVAANQLPLAEAVLKSGKVTPATLAVAKLQADARYEAPWKELFREISVEGVFSELTAEQRTALVGTYELESGSFKLVFSENEGELNAALGNAKPDRVYVVDSSTLLHSTYEFKVEWHEGQVHCVTTTMGGNPVKFVRAERKPVPDVSTPDKSESPAPDSAAENSATESKPAFQPHAEDAQYSSANWPSFRGTGARGIADGQAPPTEWNVEENKNVMWRTSIGGLGNSCPVIWGERLFVTTAISENANTDVRIGLYGDVDSVEDDSVYDYKVICLHKKTGQILWEKVLHTSRPAVKRHSKSSHANPTIATDGTNVVAFFGSEGLYCLDFDGNQKWKVDLGFLDSGWFFDPGYQWGFGSSPIIFEDRVIVQCDIQENSFVAAFDLESGRQVWRTPRQEIPTWPTPTVHVFGDIPMLLTHGTKAARGYDARDGQPLWELPGHSEIVVPTPFVARGLIFLASGYSPVQPIVALRPTARGQIELKAVESAETTESDGNKLETPSEPIAWSVMRGGPYMPTPIAYGDHLYVCANNGLITCYELLSGRQIYRERLKMGGAAAFTASPIAADGHLYFTAEDGRVAVVKAGEELDLVAINPAGQTVMSTPAISEGVFYLRTVQEVIAVCQ